MPMLAAAVAAAVAAALILTNAQPVTAAVAVIALEGASPDASSVHIGDPAAIAVGSATLPIQAPFITYGFDAGTAEAPRRVMSVPYMTNYDFAHPWTYGQKDTVNGGASFQTGTYQGSAVAIDDGRLLAWDSHFILDAPAGPERHFNLKYSSNAGATWDPAPQAEVNISPLSFAYKSNLYPTSIIQVPGGPLLLGAYAGLPGGWTSLLLKSTDAGAHWTLQSVIATGDATHRYSEVGLALDANGDLIAVMRSENHLIPPGTYYNLKLRRSANLGVTWETSAPVALPAAFDARIMPRLVLMPNGMLALVGGRPHNWLGISYAGDGRTWDYIGTFYRNFPRDYGLDGPLNYGSSGNASLAWTESNRLLLTADTCHLGERDTGVKTNTCVNRDPDYQSPITTPMIQRVLADVVRRGVGKIDLASKYRTGAIQVNTTLDSTFPLHPRTGPAGAFDGSTEQWSSAIGTSQGTFDLTLDGVYTLNRVGLSQSIGRLQSARVQTRLHDGEPWSDWFTAGPRKSFTVTYYEPPARQARQVRILTGASEGCQCSVLNELELYSTVDSFENDALGGPPPRGWVTKETIVDGAGRIGSWVTQSTFGSGSSRALLLTDTYDDHMPTAFAKATPASTRTVSFRARSPLLPAGGGALLFGVRNTSVLTFSLSTMAFHLALKQDGGIDYYSGGFWRSLAPAGTVDENAWNSFTLQLTTTQATVLVNGAVVGTATRADGASTSVHGPQFSSSSTAGTGEQHVIDDVRVS